VRVRGPKSCSRPIVTRTSSSRCLPMSSGTRSHLIDDLLDAGRISRGKIDLRRERFELASVIYHAVEASRALCDRLNHELTVTLRRQVGQMVRTMRASLRSLALTGWGQDEDREAVQESRLRCPRRQAGGRSCPPQTARRACA